MDMQHEMKRLKVLLVTVVVLLISAYFSWQEMKYGLFGKEADASLVRAYETQEIGRRGRVRKKLAIEYQFSDAGQTRTETDTVSISATPPAGPTVPVQYLGGSPGSSRLAGNTQWIWVALFFGSLGFSGFKLFQIVRKG